MLIKPFDNHVSELLCLEQQLECIVRGTAIRHAAERNLAVRRAGIKGEAESAYLIDFHFAQSPNWAVIHDLRVEYKNRVAQVDHLLINRLLECYVLETKRIRDGVKITDEGEFLRWDNYKRNFVGMASPLTQNERHIEVLRDVMGTLQLPTRLGLQIELNFQSLVLVSADARVDRPKKFDASRVIKADQLRDRTKRDFEAAGVIKVASKMVSAETVRDVASQLARLHRPLKQSTSTDLRDADTSVLQPVRSVQSAGISKVREASPVYPMPSALPAALPVAGPAAARSETVGPRCKSCQGEEGEIAYGKYGYYLKCSKCGGNTNIKVRCQNEHAARLRKAGLQFYKDCAVCTSSELYFVNK